MENSTHPSARAHDAASQVGSGPEVLTPEELERYHQDGFVVPQFRLSDAEAARLRQLITKLVADNPTRIDKVMNSPHVPGSGGQGLRSGPGWMEFAAHPVILDMIEQIMGPDIILRGTVVFYKRPGKGPPTPWHRDAVAVPITPLATTSVWIAASGSYKDNACLRYIPGTHKTRTRGKHRVDPVLGATLEDSEFDASTAVDIELDAGQMILFDLFTVHGSWPNLGTRERAAFSARYMPGTSRFDHDAVRPPELRDPRTLDPSARPLILVRGADRAGNDFRRGHPAPGNA